MLITSLKSLIVHGLTRCPAAPLVCGVVSHDGQCVFAAQLRRPHCLHAISEGVLLAQYRGATPTRYRTGMCFSPSDGEVLAGTESGAVLVWDLVTERVLTTVHAHRGVVCALHAAADAVASAATDGKICIWK